LVAAPAVADTPDATTLLCPPRRAPPGDNDLRAFRDENLSGAQPDPACRAGDNRDLAIQPSHVVLLLMYRN